MVFILIAVCLEKSLEIFVSGIYVKMSLTNQIAGLLNQLYLQNKMIKKDMLIKIHLN